MGIYNSKNDTLFDNIFHNPSSTNPNGTKKHLNGIYSVLEERTNSRKIEYIQTSISRTASEEIYQQLRILTIMDIDAKY